MVPSASQPATPEATDTKASQSINHLLKVGENLLTLSDLDADIHNQMHIRIAF